jgi:hypothetical protein
MVEWFAGGDPKCPTYGPTFTDVRLRVTPPGTSQTFTVPMSIGRNEGLCGLQVHPLTGDVTSETEAPDTGGTRSASSP